MAYQYEKQVAYQFNIIKPSYRKRVFYFNTFSKMKKYKVGDNYRYSEIPEESTEKIQVNEYGSEHLGQNAIHLRYHKTKKDVWFIWNSMANEGIFKCVYNS